MIRRTLLALGVVLGALLLSSCGSVSQNDTVAKVGDAKLSRTDLDELLNNRIVQDYLGVGEIDGDQVRVADQADRVISIWIALEAFTAAEAAPLDDDVTASSIVAGLGGDYQASFSESTGATRDVLTRYIAFQSQSQAGTLDNDKLRAAVQSADVHVDPRYGFWDPSRGSVIPFGSDLGTATTSTSTG